MKDRDANRWSHRAELAGELERPDLSGGMIRDGERQIGMRTIAEVLGRHWQGRREVTNDVVALLDALARLASTRR